MKKNTGFIALSFLSILSTGAFALDITKPLPNWIDSAREISDGGAPSIAAGQKAAPPADFHIPAEYEPVGAVVIGWAGYTDMLAAIGQAVTGPGSAQLWGVAAPASIQGVPAAKYSRINAKIDTVWMRDYGPFGVSAGQNKPGIVDTTYRHYQYRRNDDALPANLGKAKKIEVYAMPIILDGGNLMVDSKGNLYMTKRTYIWNSDKTQDQVDAALKSYFSVKNIYTFEYSGYPGEPSDGTGHIDMFMKLLNDHTVLISVADTEPFKTNSEKAMAFFKNRKAADGEMFKVIPVKAWQENGTWYTYTNSLIVNKVAIIPSYSGHSAEEAAAKAAYEAGIPGVTVVQVPSDDSITAGGSIHCVTQTIPVLPGNALKASDVYTDVVFTEPVTPLRGDGSTAVEQLLNSL
ncbi:MAG: agmatine deiminase family protein [Elusimicrobia bacterium]|nr:agmatine deiminase family protein [Elusimicrobiota bacterium]